MNKTSLIKIQKIVNELFEKLKCKLSENSFPTYGKQEDCARPNIEIDDIGYYHYITMERGQELENKKTRDLNELLYWIFEVITLEIALDYEMKNRDEKLDGRRIWFSKQEELLGLIDNEWKRKKSLDHSKILIEYPFSK